MQHIGILFGMENNFPNAVMERINQKQSRFIAQPVHISDVLDNRPPRYQVIIDRISHDVPFYRSYLKQAAYQGAKVINDPFWNSADDKYFNTVLARQQNIPVPATALLPSYIKPESTGEQSFRNLAYPMQWEEIFHYVGFPAYLKPIYGGGGKNVFRVENEPEFFEIYAQTGKLTMMLQAAIDYEAYVRCYFVAGQGVHIMHYEPRLQEMDRYKVFFDIDNDTARAVEYYTELLNRSLSYQINSVEFAIKGGTPYAIDFCNPVPDADVERVGLINAEWFVEAVATLAISRTQCG